MKSKNKKRAEAAERMKNSSYQTSRALRLETKPLTNGSRQSIQSSKTLKLK